MSATLLASLLTRLEAEDFDEEQWRLLFQCSLRIEQSKNLCNWGETLDLDERLALQKALLRSPTIDLELLDKSQHLSDINSFAELGHNPMATLWLESSPDGFGAKMLFKAMRVYGSSMASRIEKINHNLYFENLLLLLRTPPWKKSFQNEPYIENSFARIREGIAPGPGNAQMMFIKIFQNLARSVRQEAGKAMLLHQWFHALERIVTLDPPSPETPLCFLDEK